MIKKLLNSIKEFLLGQRRTGEKAYPRVNNAVKNYQEFTKDEMEAFNRWCYELNFSGMYQRKQS
jgi:3-hydroxy-3-methylglutaryl CoA synthase